MKRILVGVLLLGSLLGYSQQKKRTYKKPIKKSVKKSTAKKSTTKTIPYKVEEKKDSEVVPVVVEQVANEETKAVETPAEDNISEIIKKVSQKGGWIRNRNSAYVRGIEAFVKGTYVNKDKIYILIDVYNRTNIDYDIESISFVTAPVSKKERQVMNEEKIFIPIESTQPDKINKKSVYRLVYAFDKFTISDNIHLMFSMDENNGERTINLPIKAKYITNSEYIK